MTLSVTALIVAVETLKANLPADVLIAHSQRKQANDLVFNLVGQRGLILLHKLWLKSAITIAQSCQFESAGGSFNGLFA